MARGAAGERGQGRPAVEVILTADEKVELVRRVHAPTTIGVGEYGLSFRKHTGQWEPMPVSGNLQVIAEALTSCLASYLDRANIG